MVCHSNRTPLLFAIAGLLSQLTWATQCADGASSCTQGQDDETSLVQLAQWVKNGAARTGANLNKMDKTSKGDTGEGPSNMAAAARAALHHKTKPKMKPRHKHKEGAGERESDSDAGAGDDQLLDTLVDKWLDGSSSEKDPPEPKLEDMVDKWDGEEASGKGDLAKWVDKLESAKPKGLSLLVQHFTTDSGGNKAETNRVCAGGTLVRESTYVDPEDQKSKSCGDMADYCTKEIEECGGFETLNQKLWGKTSCCEKGSSSPKKESLQQLQIKAEIDKVKSYFKSDSAAVCAGGSVVRASHFVDEDSGEQKNCGDMADYCTGQPQDCGGISALNEKLWVHTSCCEKNAADSEPAAASAVSQPLQKMRPIAQLELGAAVTRESSHSKAVGMEAGKHKATLGSTLQELKKEAVASEDFVAAEKLKEEMESLDQLQAQKKEAIMREDFVAAQKIKEGIESIQSQGVRVVYIPKEFNGVTVLVKEKGSKWRASNDKLKAATNGIGHRASKNLEDKTDPPSILPWGETLDEGEDEGDGWVRFFIEMKPAAALQVDATSSDQQPMNMPDMAPQMMYDPGIKIMRDLFEKNYNTLHDSKMMPMIAAAQRLAAQSAAKKILPKISQATQAANYGVAVANQGATALEAARQYATQTATAGMPSIVHGAHPAMDTRAAQPQDLASNAKAAMPFVKQALGMLGPRVAFGTGKNDGSVLESTNPLVNKMVNAAGVGIAGQPISSVPTIGQVWQQMSPTQQQGLQQVFQQAPNEQAVYQAAEGAIGSEMGKMAQKYMASHNPAAQHIKSVKNNQKAIVGGVKWMHGMGDMMNRFAMATQQAKKNMGFNPFVALSTNGNENVMLNAEGSEAEEQAMVMQSAQQEQAVEQAAAAATVAEEQAENQALAQEAAKAAAETQALERATAAATAAQEQAAQMSAARTATEEQTLAKASESANKTEQAAVQSADSATAVQDQALEKALAAKAAAEEQMVKEAEAKTAAEEAELVKAADAASAAEEQAFAKETAKTEAEEKQAATVATGADANTFEKDAVTQTAAEAMRDQMLVKAGVTKEQADQHMFAEEAAAKTAAEDQAIAKMTEAKTAAEDKAIAQAAGISEQAELKKMAAAAAAEEQAEAKAFAQAASPEDREDDDEAMAKAAKVEDEAEEKAMAQGSANEEQIEAKQSMVVKVNEQTSEAAYQKEAEADKIAAERVAVAEKVEEQQGLGLQPITKQNTELMAANQRALQQAMAAVAKR